MTTSLFSGHTGRSLLIRRVTDSYGEEGRRREAEGSFPPAFLDKINNPVGLNAVNLQLSLDEVFHVHS